MLSMASSAKSAEKAFPKALAMKMMKGAATKKAMKAKKTRAAGTKAMKAASTKKAMKAMKTRAAGTKAVKAASAKKAMATMRAAGTKAVQAAPTKTGRCISAASVCLRHWVGPSRIYVHFQILAGDNRGARLVLVVGHHVYPSVEKNIKKDLIIRYNLYEPCDMDDELDGEVTAMGLLEPELFFLIFGVLGVSASVLAKQALVLRWGLGCVDVSECASRCVTF